MVAKLKPDVFVNTNPFLEACIRRGLVIKAILIKLL